MIWKVAKIIIESYHASKLDITNLRLQKILYFIQERVAKDLKIIPFEEEMQAWTFGPVFPVVYNYYSLFGRNNISSVIHDDLDEPISSKIQLIVEAEIERTKHVINTWELVKESHADDKVWAKVTNSGKNVEYQTIPANKLLGE